MIENCSPKGLKQFRAVTEKELKTLYAGVYEMSVARDAAHITTSDFTYEVVTADNNHVIPVNCVQQCAKRGFKYGEPNLIADLVDALRQVAFLHLLTVSYSKSSAFAPIK